MEITSSYGNISDYGNAARGQKGLLPEPTSPPILMPNNSGCLSLGKYTSAFFVTSQLFF